MWLPTNDMATPTMPIPYPEAPIEACLLILMLLYGNITFKI